MLVGVNGATALFTQVGGIAFDSAGNIYVTDDFARSIRIFDPERREIGEIEDVEGAGSFAEPALLAVDSDDNRYVQAYGSGRTLKLVLPTPE